MFNKIIRYYNQNRRRVILVIIIIAFIIVIIQILNQVEKQKNQKVLENNEIKTNQIPNQVLTQNPNYSITSNEKISSKITKENQEIIEQFINACNEQKIEEAYSLLSEECKELIYPSIEEFYNQYYQKVFQNKRSVSLEAWSNTNSEYTYKVNITNDILSEGKIDTSNAYEDYYTIVTQNDEKRLNINRLINKKSINMKAEQDQIVITVLNKISYKDYQEYEVKFENKTDNTILIDTKENTKSVYIEDQNGVQYIAFMNKLAEETLKVEPKNEHTITIQVNKLHNLERREQSISFTDIVQNFDEYNSLENKQDYKDRISIVVQL